MNFGKFHFGGIEIDGVTYERDVVIDRGRIRKRKKKPSKKFREEFGHPGLGRGRDTLEVQTPHSRHGKIWIASGDERGETRGAPPKSRSADFAHGRSYPDACQPI
jgi:hypothetical protein